jgi:hypothetical protein
MTDKELLELAAKAAGIDLDQVNGPIVNGGVRLQDNWNPLVDDGEALRLAVTLKLELGFPREAIVWSFGRKGEVCSENYSKDLYSATRRAIVRAAAEIGRSVK